LEDAAAIKRVVIIISCRGTHPSIAYIVGRCRAIVIVAIVVVVTRRHRRH
jgi:hypothetical protein